MKPERLKIRYDMQPFMTNRSLPLCVIGEIRKDGNICNVIIDSRESATSHTTVASPGAPPGSPMYPTPGRATIGWGGVGGGLQVC